jgi:hypothetical protein
MPPPARRVFQSSCRRKRYTEEVVHRLTVPIETVPLR